MDKGPGSIVLHKHCASWGRLSCSAASWARALSRLFDFWGVSPKRLALPMTTSHLIGQQPAQQKAQHLLLPWHSAFLAFLGIHWCCLKESFYFWLPHTRLFYVLQLCFSVPRMPHYWKLCLNRFLPPCPAQPPCLRFLHSSCSHTLLTSIHSTCPANRAKLEWAGLQYWWTGYAPGLCHSSLTIWCSVFCWKSRFKHFNKGRIKFHSIVKGA